VASHLDNMVVIADILLTAVGGSTTPTLAQVGTPQLPPAVANSSSPLRLQGRGLPRRLSSAAAGDGEDQHLAMQGSGQALDDELVSAVGRAAAALDMASLTTRRDDTRASSPVLTARPCECARARPPRTGSPFSTNWVSTGG
jgi:hypothetical protein